MKVVVIIVFFLISGYLIADVPKFYSIDPSLIPEEHFEKSNLYLERLRIIVDLDGDGVDDLLLSEPNLFFGTMGGSWGVYLSRRRKYKYVGSITAHPKAISFEPDHDRNYKKAKDRKYTRIWVYLKSSGSEGGFGYFRIGEDSIENFVSIEIYPGDAGSDLGRAVYGATFNKSIIPFTLQYSRTDRSGKVKWKTNASSNIM